MYFRGIKLQLFFKKQDNLTLFPKFIAMTQVFEFLSALEQNNNREWFMENKVWYQSAYDTVLQFLDQRLIPGVATFDPSVQNVTAKQCIFRIYRDVRFSKDKTPYKTHFGAYIGPQGRKSKTASYYFHLQPGNSFVGGGVYHPSAEALKAIRTEIYYNINRLNEIRFATDFKETFGCIAGDKLKRLPIGFPKNFSAPELLKFKDYIVAYNLKDSEIMKPRLDQYLLNIFKKQKPFNDFLNEALLNGEDG